MRLSNFLEIPRAFVGFLLLCWAMSANVDVRAEDDIVLPALLGLTGSSAPFGNGEREAITLAIEEWNERDGIGGKKIRLQVEDTHTDAKTLVSAYNKLVHVDGHHVLIGPTWLDSFQGAIPLAYRDQTLLVTPSAAVESFEKRPEGRTFVLSTYFSSRREIQSLVQHLRERGVKKVVIATDLDPYFQLLKRLFLEAAKKHELDVIDVADFNTGETDFKSYFPRVRKVKPDAIIFFLQRSETTHAFFKQRMNLYPDVFIAAIHDMEGFLEQKDVAPLLHNLLYTRLIVANKEFVEKFKRRWGHAPMLTTSNAYDAANMVLNAFASGLKSSREIRDFLLNSTHETATFGKVKFEADGSIQEGIVEAVSID